MWLRLHVTLTEGIIINMYSYNYHNTILAEMPPSKSPAQLRRSGENLQNLSRPVIAPAALLCGGTALMAVFNKQNRRPLTGFSAASLAVVITGTATFAKGAAMRAEADSLEYSPQQRGPNLRVVS
jgi:hypothetical protein